jgi:hypothetical protein
LLYSTVVLLEKIVCDEVFNADVLQTETVGKQHNHCG